jgi:hypothetical protein
MNWRILLLPLALLAAAGCAAPNEVVPLGDGVLRAMTYVQATDYCSARNASPRWLGKAQAEQGVRFQCTRD